MKFGTAYFYHPQEAAYSGPTLTKDLGASFMQIDFADICMWAYVMRNKGAYDWSVTDKAYDECEKNGIEPVPTFGHHLAPPEWVPKGLLNNSMVSTPKYGKLYGKQYGRLTVPQKLFADFVTEFVKRYGERTRLYALSHEWNLEFSFYTKEGTPEYDVYVDNQVGCTLLAYNIIKRADPKAKLTYALLNQYIRDSVGGKQLTPLDYQADRNPFGPSYMIKKFVETGNKEFIDLLKTIYFFHLGYTYNPVGRDPICIDSLAGDAAEELYKRSVTVDDKVYRYKDYIKEVIVNFMTISGKWGVNKEKAYSQEEQAGLVKDSMENVLAAASRRVPITSIVHALTDKNEDWGPTVADHWQRYLFVPEGLYQMVEWKDPLAQQPTMRQVTFKPKKAAKVFKEYAAKYGSKGA